MSGLVVFAFILLAAAAFVLVLVNQMAGSSVWGRLVLVALLTRVFDRPQTKGSVRLRS